MLHPNLRGRAPYKKHSKKIKAKVCCVSSLVNIGIYIWTVSRGLLGGRCRAIFSVRYISRLRPRDCPQRLAVSGLVSYSKPEEKQIVLGLRTLRKYFFESTVASQSAFGSLRKPLLFCNMLPRSSFKINENGCEMFKILICIKIKVFSSN
jgi:hypothetical protein